MKSDRKRLEENKKKVNCFIQTAHYNQVKCSHFPAEKRQHRRGKWYVADWCYERGLSFATEVVFKDKSRADVVIFGLGIIIEILHTESLKDFKKKTYPLPAYPLRVKVFDRQKIWDLLDDVLSTFGDGLQFYIDKVMEK